MIVRFLFWNMNKMPLVARLARLVATNEIDIVLLAECESPGDELISGINRGNRGSFIEEEGVEAKIRIISRLAPRSFVHLFSDPRGGLTIKRLEVGPPPGILLAAVHFNSRREWSEPEQDLVATVLARDIINVEQEQRIERTVLVGDFNMNPFDMGVRASNTLHGVMTRRLALKGQRNVNRRPYRFFYNPMWGCFGDRTEGPPGTFYHRSSSPGNLFWNMYDQVLIRPSLIGSFKDLRILDRDGHESLLTKHGLPDKSRTSDHLPIFFVLSF